MTTNNNCDIYSNYEYFDECMLEELTIAFSTSIDNCVARLYRARSRIDTIIHRIQYLEEYYHQNASPENSDAELTVDQMHGVEDLLLKTIARVEDEFRIRQDKLPMLDKACYGTAVPEGLVHLARGSVCEPRPEDYEDEEYDHMYISDCEKYELFSNALDCVVGNAKSASVEFKMDENDGIVLYSASVKLSDTIENITGSSKKIPGYFMVPPGNFLPFNCTMDNPGMFDSYFLFHKDIFEFRISERAKTKDRAPRLQMLYSVMVHGAGIAAALHERSDALEDTFSDDGLIPRLVSRDWKIVKITPTTVTVRKDGGKFRGDIGQKIFPLMLTHKKDSMNTHTVELKRPSICAGLEENAE